MLPRNEWSKLLLEEGLGRKEGMKWGRKENEREEIRYEKMKDREYHGLELFFLDGASCCNSIDSGGIRRFRYSSYWRTIFFGSRVRYLA